jgi:hypothetical protein
MRGEDKNEGAQEQSEALRAWDAAWEAATEPCSWSRSSRTLRREPDLAPLRPALAQAIGPALAELALAVREAFDRVEAAEKNRNEGDKSGEERWAWLKERQARAEAFDRLLDDALRADAFEEAASACAKALGPGCGMSGSRVGALLTRAAIGHAQHSGKSAEKRDRALAWLASDKPEALALWAAWEAANGPGTVFSVMADRDADQMQWALGALICGVSKRPQWSELGARVAQRIAVAELWGGGGVASCWPVVGQRAGETMKHQYPRAGAAIEPLRAVLPPDFWIGALSVFGEGGKLSRWLFESLLREASEDPAGALADDLCAGAWLGLSLGRAQAIERAMPGRSVATLAKIDKRGAYDFKGHLSDLGANAKGRGASWALRALKAQGAPTTEKDLGYDGALHRWVRENPEKTKTGLLAANAALEAAEIAKAAKAGGPADGAAKGPGAAAAKAAKKAKRAARRI